MGCDSFDVLAVTGRLLSIPTPARTWEEAHWGISAIDRLRGFFDARQAQLTNDATLLALMPPLPPLPDPGGGDAAGAADDGGVGSASGPGDGTDGSGDATGSSSSPGGADDFPPLGDGAKPSLSRREREIRERRAWILGLSSLFADALATHKISTGHVDMLAAVLHGVTETVRDRVLDDEIDLLASAMAGSPEFFARAIRRAIDRITAGDGHDQAARQRSKSKVREWDDKPSGMHHIHAELDPELALRFTAALNAEIEAMYRSGAAKDLSHDRVSALALVNLVSSARGGERRSDPDRVQFIVLADFETLFGGLHDCSILETASGTAIHLKTARRLWCDAEVTWAITINGNVATLISEDELATRQQRRALRAMYRTCVHPDCDVPFDRCHIHHVTYRHHGGKTLIGNLVPVCYRHHHLVHEGRWQLTMDGDRTLRWRTPHTNEETECPFVPLAHLDRTRSPAAGTSGAPPGRNPSGTSPGAPPGPTPRPRSAASPPGHAPSDACPDPAQVTEPRLFDDPAA